MLSIVSYMNTDAGKAVILLGGGIGNHIYTCTVKLHKVLKKRTLLCSPCAMSLSPVTSVVVNSQSWNSHGDETRYQLNGRIKYQTNRFTISIHEVSLHYVKAGVHYRYWGNNSIQYVAY